MIIDRLNGYAKTKGIEVIDRGNGHYQLKGGALTVNYYPNSKKMTAYIAGMNKGYNYIMPEKAVDMCFDKPEPTGIKDKRYNVRKNQTIRNKMLKKCGRKCYWCGCLLTRTTATLEHIIPLSLGGLNNENNMTVACEDCNKSRGSDMPELNRVATS